MPKVNNIVAHYQWLIEQGLLTPEEVPVARQIRDEWSVSSWAAERVRSRLLAAGLATSAPSSALPLGPITDELMQTRFWPKVDPVNADGCLIWNSRCTGDYGGIALNGRLVYVHRVAYEYLTGEPIPEGLELDHVFARGCRSRRCVRLEHLEPVTRFENARRRDAARRWRASIQVWTELDDD